jgi:pimeloyl-ACP methyl ester carboxylesterase
MLPHASHIFMTDQPEAAHRAVVDFLAAQTAQRREMQA